MGCGRLLGLTAPMACLCWRSVNRGALIPYRIRGWQRRVAAAYAGVAAAKSDSEKTASDAVCRALNRSMRAAV